MPRLVLRLLALLALFVMPLVMASAPAMAEAAPPAAGHCDEHPQPAEVPASAPVHCTGCAALPVFEPPAAAEPMSPEAPAHPALADAIAGIEPGTDPPPPKRS